MTFASQFRRSLAASTGGAATVGLTLWLTGSALAAIGLATAIGVVEVTTLGPLAPPVVDQLAVVAGGGGVVVGLFGLSVATTRGTTVVVGLVAAAVATVAVGALAVDPAWAPSPRWLQRSYVAGLVVVFTTVASGLYRSRHAESADSPGVGAPPPDWSPDDGVDTAADATASVTSDRSAVAGTDSDGADAAATTRDRSTPDPDGPELGPGIADAALDDDATAASDPADLVTSQRDTEAVATGTSAFGRYAGDDGDAIQTQTQAETETEGFDSAAPDRAARTATDSDDGTDEERAAAARSDHDDPDASVDEVTAADGLDPDSSFRFGSVTGAESDAATSDDDTDRDVDTDQGVDAAAEDDPDDEFHWVGER